MGDGAAEARRGGVGVALDDEVELARAPAEQEVADGAAHEPPTPSSRGERPQQPRAAGSAPSAARACAALRIRIQAGARTGTPAAARCALASGTVSAP